MMMLVGMSDPGLLILPTHRLVSGFPGLTAESSRHGSQPEFEVTITGEGEAGCRAAWEAIEQGGDQDLLGFGTVADGRWLLARLRSDAAMDRLAPEHSPEWRSLGVSVLHVLVLDDCSLKPLGKPIVPLRPPAPRSPRPTSPPEGCDLACLVPPARMEHVEAIASNLETMPPKSTYFYPKLLTGWCLTPCAGSSCRAGATPDARQSTPSRRLASSQGIATSPRRWWISPTGRGTGPVPS